LGQVIELCRRCGFEIPADARSCPGCRQDDDATSLVARLVAGDALPSRSVHPLPHIRARRERKPAGVGPARGVRAVLGFTFLLLVLALVGVALGWMVGLERFVLSLPQELVGRIDNLTRAATWAAVIGLGLGLLALTARGIRQLGIGIAHRVGAPRGLAHRP